MAALPESEKSPDSDSEIPIFTVLPAAVPPAAVVAAAVVAAATRAAPGIAKSLKGRRIAKTSLSVNQTIEPAGDLGTVLLYVPA